MNSKFPGWLFWLCGGLLVVAMSNGCRSRQNTGPAFDVPSLLGQKISGIESRLGAAETPGDAANTTTSDTKRAVFQRDDFSLSVDYLQHSGRVTAFTIAPATAGQSRREQDKGEFLQAGQLREGDPRYAVDWLEDPDKMFYVAGVKVTPAPVSHRVILRALSSFAVLTVHTSGVPAATTAASSLVPPGDSAPGTPGPNPPAVAPPADATFQTFPTWETTFTAQTGAVLTLEAAPFQTRRSPAIAGAPSTTVQILVDGQVAAQNMATDGIAHVTVELD